MIYVLQRIQVLVLVPVMVKVIQHGDFRKFLSRYINIGILELFEDQIENFEILPTTIRCNRRHLFPWEAA